MRRLRGFLSWLLYDALPCRTCGRPRVGFAVYCRQHVDEINARYAGRP